MGGARDKARDRPTPIGVFFFLFVLCLVPAWCLDKQGLFFVLFYYGHATALGVGGSPCFRASDSFVDVASARGPARAETIVGVV